MWCAIVAVTIAIIIWIIYISKKIIDFQDSLDG